MYITVSTNGCCSLIPRHKYRQTWFLKQKRLARCMRSAILSFFSGAEAPSRDVVACHHLPGVDGPRQLEVRRLEPFEAAVRDLESRLQETEQSRWAETLQNRMDGLVRTLLVIEGTF